MKVILPAIDPNEKASTKHIIKSEPKQHTSLPKEDHKDIEKKKLKTESESESD